MQSRFKHLASIADIPFRERPDLSEFFEDQQSYGLGMHAGAITARDRNLSARAATIIVLLLERHHAVTGEWPAALEDIMPREETLDPNTLTPFVYALTPDGPFPFSLTAPAEATFIPEEVRDFTKPRHPLPVQNTKRR